ncbi:hypothetical protein ABOM_004001 [Aspergillus bombycis]|uniref:Ketosynthase family 3 (KS3) domain-containing protein n=1 Tax=Aspergillus bombycis TaxID=109264 RepID=A0A1F8A6X7_9EURO|nr:hypothetical protein ABOM_004001 [Aspergillus bombycis]OGM47139.1 hypothetical protein ABOM_004001 [Aspergillus bombycis]
MATQAVSVSKAPDDQDSIAFELLIELLSYHLASPVQWIETQNELLQQKPPIHRVVEVGPRTILATMAKKTAEKRHLTRSPAQSSKYSFLSIADNSSDIHYEYNQEEEASNNAPPPAIQVEDSVSKAENPPAAPQPTPQAPSVSKSMNRAPTQQVALSASHILVALVGEKLNKPFDHIPPDSTIQECSNGRSTIQNEIIGALVSEFGRLPDGAEYMPLKALGDALQARFSHQPGKQMSPLLSKFINGKMPSGFNKATIHDYLESSWGLDKDHSIVPLCFAITLQPTSRLASRGDAEDFFDTVVSRYAPYVGISFAISQTSTIPEPPVNRTANGNSLPDHILDPNQSNLLAAYHTLIQPQSDGRLEELTASAEEMTQRLAEIQAELGDQFLDGIKPVFDLGQIRQYDSWWNWVRIDLLRWLRRTRSSSEESLLDRDEDLRHILNRWEPSCTNILQSQVSSSITATGQGAFYHKLLQLSETAELADPVFMYKQPALAPKTIIDIDGTVRTVDVPRKTSGYADLIRETRMSASGTELPFINVQTRAEGANFAYDVDATRVLAEAMKAGTETGFTYIGKSALVTGAGTGSIGAEIVKGLLSGGAHVVVTTSRSITTSSQAFQDMYKAYAGRGAKLTVVPMNQGSQQDCEALIQYIYGPESPTGGDLDFVIPFAALNQVGEIHMLDGRAEVAQRTMLVNLLRILGEIRKEKERRNITTRPTTVILPMTCNEGTIGSDGLYPESKIALRSLFNRFYSETWADYLHICGTAIGWTRGTGIMQPLNNISEEIEKLGVITFTPAETAFNILSLMTTDMIAMLEGRPILVDMAAGLCEMWNIKETISRAFATVAKKQKVQKALQAEKMRHEEILCGPATGTQPATPNFLRRANIQLDFPELPHHDEIRANLPRLDGMVDLSQTVVVVGYSELGPWGNSRTRWEIEHQGRFSLEGYVEIARIMGLIKYFSGDINGQAYSGWIDEQTNDPVRDDEIPQKYHEHIMNHVGLRMVEPEAALGYDPAKKESLHEIVVDGDLPPFECSKATAESFKRRHGDNVSIYPLSDEEYRVVVKRGTSLLVPKATIFETTVAGQVPKGWDPLKYGIPEDVVQQVDRLTLYMLCCLSEALLSAGITDPYELYKHIHVSELASCLGSGGGPIISLQRMFRDRYMERPVRNDILAESFYNTIGAWVNMLLFSSTGPLRTPVGACATALESLDSACEAIQSGKYRVALVGAADDFTEQHSYEFAQMKATVNSTEDLKAGRPPGEMSRPTATSRQGFVESAGSGAQILMTAELAMEMGLPIYGIVAYSQLAGDQIGRSVPAPGKGLLCAARQAINGESSPFLDLNYRRTMFQDEMVEIDNWHNKQLLAKGPSQHLETIRVSRVQGAQHRWANNLWLQDRSISPIKAALATWGLTIDDIQVASLHGTSTKANDLNESDVVNTQMTHLGRTLGNPLLVVCQKSLTGHPKGPAGAWQVNGCLQMLRTGIVPGNRNADNVDEQLRQFQHLAYPSQSLTLDKIRAAMVTSFGFGQKGAVAIVISPNYVFAAVSQSTFDDYRSRALQRQQSANPAYVFALLNNSMVKIKSSSPWKDQVQLRQMLLDPHCRLSEDGSLVTKQPAFETAQQDLHVLKSQKASATLDMQPMDSKPLYGAVQEMIESIPASSLGASAISVGIDVEDISSVNSEDAIFVERNFTAIEREICLSSPNPRASYAGRWSAKEAVFKSLSVQSRGPGAEMASIEILSDSGIPKVKLHGPALEAATLKGINRIEVSISHAAGSVVAIALAHSS